MYMSKRKSVKFHNSNLREKDYAVKEADLAPSINLHFLHSSRHDLKHIDNLYRKDRSKRQDFLELFETFINEFQTFPTIGKAIQAYASHNSGAKNIVPDIVDNVINSSQEDIRNYIRNEIQHLHFRKGGKGKEIIWGFVYGNSFYILAIEVGHNSV